MGQRRSGGQRPRSPPPSPPPPAKARAKPSAAAAAASAAAAPPPAPAFPATPDGYRAYARTQVDATQFRCLDALWTRESGWRATPQNPPLPADGLAQLLNSPS